MRKASNGGKLRLAHDLQHAGMRHANTLRDGAKTHALGVRRTNGNAPSLFGLGTFAGKTAKVSGGHLRDEQLVAICPEGGLVLDPFIGSGSTLDAARNRGRRALGFEIDEAHVEMASLRLAQGSLGEVA